MAYWSRKWNCLVLLYFVVSTISVSSAIRIDDILYGRVKHIPLKRTQPGKFGFLRGDDLDKFGNELAELHNDRAKRSVEDTVRQTNGSLITEFELKGDNHSVAFLHWAGKKSTVIYIYTCGKINNTESDHILCEDAFFWRSNDSGSTFQREEFKKPTINNVDFCDSNSEKVIVSILSSKVIYTSVDGGENFREISLTFVPHVISCNPVSDKMIIGHDTTAQEVHYSVDGGITWNLLAKNVVNHYWGYGSQSEVFLEVKTENVYSSVLKHALLKDSNEAIVKVFDKSLGTFVERSFEIVGRYMFVQKYTTTKELHVFYKKNASSYSGQNFFQRAQFPLKQVEGKGYKVVDASENEVMVVVRHGIGFYSLYISDESGVKYALSREYILGNETWYGANVLLWSTYTGLGV
ncbi:VPS10 domain-containing receptor SorCS1-like [Acropora muricata]|uniref:VPS10 domain-containing receptor SorCS1-like n=1 Tax=Acropora muricata TaxID=159855 RepID=UPI0034E5454A